MPHPKNLLHVNRPKLILYTKDFPEKNRKKQKQKTVGEFRDIRKAVQEIISEKKRSRVPRQRQN